MGRSLKINSDSTRVDIAQVLETPRVPTSHAIGHGPMAALRVWQSNRRNVAETAAWLEETRLEAILGNCRRRLPSVIRFSRVVSAAHVMLVVCARLG